VKPAPAVFSARVPDVRGGFRSHSTVLPMTTSVPVVPNSKKRHTLFTLNNWTVDELNLIRDYAEKEAKYMCWSQEVAPSTGTPHLQGYVAWDNPRSLDKFKKAISPRLHYGDENGNTNGTAEQNRAYCLGMVEKKGFTHNPTFEEVGEIPQQGARTDWRQAVTHLQGGGEIHTVVEHQPQLLPCIRALERYKQISLRPLNRNVNVIVLVGASGTGKSKWAYDNYPELYSKPDGQWYDGYTGQKTLLLDDYYGDIPYSQLLKVCDRYPLQVPVKGGFIYAQWDTVIITSNKQPEHWYPAEDLAAFKRRITRLDREYNNGKNCKDSLKAASGWTCGCTPPCTDASTPYEGCTCTCKQL